MVLLLRLFLSQKGDITKKKIFEELAGFRRHFFALTPDDIKVLFHQVATEDIGTWKGALGSLSNSS